MKLGGQLYILADSARRRDILVLHYRAELVLDPVYVSQEKVNLSLHRESNIGALSTL